MPTNEDNWGNEPSDYFTKHSISTNADWCLIADAEVAILNLLPGASADAALDICHEFPQADHISKVHSIMEAAKAAYNLALLQKEHMKAKPKQ